MKTIINRKTSNSFVKMIIGLASVAALVSSCDELNVDPDKGNPNSTISDNTIYVRPGGSAFIDLASKVTTNQAITLSLNADATAGELETMGNGILQYSPKSGMSNGRDSFGYTILDQNNEVIKEDSVIIIVEDDPENLPSGIYPTIDIVFGVADDSVVVVDVLANDFLSNYSISELEVTIYYPDADFPPYSGSAQLVDNKVVYTASSNFPGADKVMYKISVKNDPSIVAYGLVYLTSETACFFSLTDDNYVSAGAFTQIRIPALDNDQLCTSLYNYSVTISTQPALGNVYVESDVFVYQPTQTAEGNFSDYFIYKVNIDGVVKTARVNISVGSDSTTCILTAVADYIDLRDSTATDLNIDALQNDVICNQDVVLTIEIDPTYGTASVIQGSNGESIIQYIPSAQQVQDDKITYKLTSTDSVSVASILIKRTN